MQPTQARLLNPPPKMAKARVTARGLQELDDDMRERNARMLQSIADVSQTA